MRFTETAVTYTFYNIADIIGKLGGLGATAEKALKAFAVIFVLQFVWAMTEMIKRINLNKIRKLEIRRGMSKLDYIEKEVRRKLDNKPDKKKYNKDLELIKEVKDMSQNDYDEIEKKHKIVQRLMENHWSDNVDQSDWAKYEKEEFDRKHALYKARSEKTNLAVADAVRG